jgi:hypothetical protein
MNKRLHKLKRIIRYEYNCFITLCYPKYKALILLQHVSNLLFYKILYLNDIGNISEDERRFMLRCNNIYYIYYKVIIHNAY